MAEGLTKKQLKELRKLEKLQSRNLEQKNNNVKWIAISIVSALFLLLFVGVVLVTKNNNQPATESGKVEIAQTGHERIVRTNPAEATDSAAVQQVVTLVEYADIQCPACRAYHPMVKELLASYPDRVRLLFKHFPLMTIHPNAMPAAIAAEAAGRQNKFFEFVDLAYENQAEWSGLPNATNKFNEYAQSLGLDVEQFKKDMEDPALRKTVEEQREEGLNNGVSGTPTFFLEGERIENPSSLDELKGLVDQKLTATNAQPTESSEEPTSIPENLPLQP